MIILLPFFISLFIYITLVPINIRYTNINLSIIKSNKDINNKENISDNIIIFGLLSLAILLILNLLSTPEILLMLLLIGIIIYWIEMVNTKSSNDSNFLNRKNYLSLANNSNQISLLGSTFILGSYFALMSTNLVSFFVSVELLSFTMLILVNLYIQDQYPGILYYLFSGLFSALFIFALGTMSMGYSYNLSVNILYVVFFYKLGLAPFHILLPQIYQNLSIQYILLMDVPYKIILFFLFAKIYWISCFNSLVPIIIISLITGCIGSLRYKNLLSILIYSSLYHYGLILITINYFHLDYLFYYIFIYSFTIILYLYLITYKFIDRQIISYNKIYILLWFLLIMNLIGIPPFSGFFIKFYPLYITLFNYNYLLFIISIFGILLLTFTYLRILLSIIFGKFEYNKLIKNKNNVNGNDLSSFGSLFLTKTTDNINNKLNIKIKNNNVLYSHLISSLIMILSIPLIY